MCIAIKLYSHAGCKWLQHTVWITIPIQDFVYIVMLCTRCLLPLCEYFFNFLCTFTELILAGINFSESKIFVEVNTFFFARIDFRGFFSINCFNIRNLALIFFFPKISSFKVK